MAPRRLLKSYILIAFLPFLLFLFFTCSDKSTDPTIDDHRTELVTIQGNVDLPSGSDLHVDSLTITAGVFDQTTPNAAGELSIGLNPGATQLVSATTSSGDPVLLCIEIDPKSGDSVELSCQTTAEAMIFLHPVAVVADPELAQAVLSIITSMTETEELASVIESKIAANPAALVGDDDDIRQALINAVNAFLVEVDGISANGVYSDTLIGSIKEFKERKHFRNADHAVAAEQQTQVGELTITPTARQSGIAISASPIDDYNYKITLENSKKRYVDVYLDDDEEETTVGKANLQSRKSLVSFEPLGPDTRDLSHNLNIAVHPNTILRAYGPGNNDRDALIAAPSWKTRSFGPTLYTGYFDFFIPLVQVISGVRSFTHPSSWDHPGGALEAIMTRILIDEPFRLQVYNEMGRGNYTDAICLIVQKAVQVILSHPEYLLDWLKEQGLDAVASTVAAACVPLRIGFVVASGFEMGTAIYDFLGASWLVSWTLVADNPPPGAITDLVASNHPNEGTVWLDWTAPGSDGNVGQAEEYDIRYSTQNITESNWNSATQVEGEYSPNSAGSDDAFLIPGLDPNTTYYFAIKTSDDVSWSDLSNIASITTPDVEDVTPPAAIVDLTASNPTSISITLNWTAPGDDGNEGQATEYDIRYSTSAISDVNWNLASQVESESDPQLAGSAEQFAVPRLNPNTLYFFAIKTRDDDSNWSIMSNIDSLATEDHETGTVTDIDDNVYSTVKIGNQWWMAENLKVTHYCNGDPIPYVTDDGKWSGLTTGAYCDYENAVNNVATYGRLYNWYAVADSRNIAPAGWHVPTDEEWKQLEVYLGMDQAEADATGWRGFDEGGKLKEAGTTHWSSPNIGATNQSGFSALPGGFRSGSYGYFNFMWNSAHFWSSPEYDSYGAWNRYLSNLDPDVSRYVGSKQYGFSVRCVMGEGLGVPELTTASVTNITKTTAECGGSITSDGGAAVTARGVCWSTDDPPTVADSKTTDGSGTGSFTSSITGLDAGTDYYVRAYATNSVETDYGSSVSFTTNQDDPNEVRDIDGNVYQTVQIGNQWWMAENLKVTRYRNGDSISHVTNNAEWAALTTGAYCEYENNIVNVATYGRLYNWYAVDDNRNIAPAGWHVPSDAEWQTLAEHLGGVAIAGGKLKEVSITHWNSPNTGATNESGFTALPGAKRSPDGFFDYMGRLAYFWSSTKFSSSEYAGSGKLQYNISWILLSNSKKLSGFSVRCVRD